MSMMSEFKEFAVKGNAIDLAVGVVIGAAFGKIVASLVSDIVNPIISIFTGKLDFSELTIPLGAENAITYGAFLNVIIEFLIVAFAIFLVVRQMNKMKKEEPAAEPTEKDCSFCMSKVAIKATRCPACTSELKGASA